MQFSVDDTRKHIEKCGNNPSQKEYKIRYSEKLISKREVRAIVRAKLVRKKRYELAQEYEESKYEAEAEKNDQGYEDEETEKLSIE